MTSMYLTAREKQILFQLLSADQAVTVQSLAERLKVSKRTVQRDVKGLQPLLSEHGLSAESDSRGMFVEGSAEQKQSLLRQAAEIKPFEYTADERQTMIVCHLLEADEPVKLAALAHELRVTSATVSHDLDAVEETLKPYDLALIRKRGYGVEIAGKERHIRQFMSGLLADQLGVKDTITALKDKIDRDDTVPLPAASERLLGLIDRDKLAVVEKTVKDGGRALRLRLADRALVGLIVHVALAVGRLENGETIEMKDELLEELKATKEYGWAQTLAERLSPEFGIALPESEVGYITMHLRGAKVRIEKAGDTFDEAHWRLMQACRRLMEILERRLGVRFSDSEPLLQGLATHLRPAMYRMKHHMPIENPLLSQIKHNYRKLFTVLQEAMPEVFPDLEVPETEIGYLVMHFGASLRAEVCPVSALVICSSGIGSSKLLASRLAQTFPEMERIDHGAVHDLREQDLSAYDLILSTVPIQNVGRQVIEVNPFLKDGDIRQIRQALAKLRNPESTGAMGTRKQSKDSGEKAASVTGGEVLDKIHRYTDAIQAVLTGFSVTAVDGGTMEEVLYHLVKSSKQDGAVVDEARLRKKLLERQQLSGMGLPGSGCALFHSKDEAVSQVHFTVHPLKRPLTIAGMDGAAMTCKTVLLMLAPGGSSEETMQVLSRVSTLVIENERSLALFEEGNETAIRRLLEQKLMGFFKEQLNKLGVREP
ncbi:MAG TPA: BglG family transcription antiterminator [Bacillales bacterium]|nr:BglG family transcription antiterminator [Bacillales bacterium]